MTKDTDRADSEVKGIARYIPSLLSKAILVLLPGATWFVFSTIREHPTWFVMELKTPLEQTLIAALVAAAFAWLLTLVLVLDMAVAVHQSKHRRIVHYSNEHPLMSFRFLAANATAIHWLSLGVLCAAFAGVGFVLAKT